MIFDSLIFKEDGSFYIDVNELPDDLSVDVSDCIRFTYEGKKYFGKVEIGKYSFDKIHSITLLK